MFGADGELRDEFRHLESAPVPEPAAAEPEPVEPEPAEAEVPEEEETESGARFQDLVQLLAENASIHLSQADAPGPDQRQNVELSKLYIDLLTILKTKTAGNLKPGEGDLLDNALYQLRLAFAQRRGF